MQHGLVEPCQHFKIYKEIKNGSMNGLKGRTFFIAELIPLIARKVRKSYS